MFSVDLPPTAPLFTNWTRTRPTGFIESDEEITEDQVERLAAAWKAGDLVVLPKGARFRQPFDDQPQAMLSETIETTTPGFIKWLAVGTVANSIGVIAVALAVILG